MDEIVSIAMTIHDASAYLIRFDAQAPAPEEDDPSPESAFCAEEAVPLQAAAIDPEALRREIEAEFALILQKQKEAHEESFRLAREEWVEREAESLRRALAQGLQSAFESLRADMARALAPFVCREIEERTIEEVIDAIRRAIADDHAPMIAVAGPKDLVNKVSLAFAKENVAVDIAADDVVDIVVDLPKTRIETRLGAWMRSLSEKE